MKLIFNSNGGFRRIPDSEFAAATAEGWVDGQPIWDAAMEAKRKDAAKSDTVTIANVQETATMVVQSEVKRSPGRPKRASILNNGEV